MFIRRGIMFVRELKRLIAGLDDTADVKIEITDAGYNLLNVDVHTYEIGDDYITLQGEIED